jgi:hypothetical protein
LLDKLMQHHAGAGMRMRRIDIAALARRLIAL